MISRIDIRIRPRIDPLPESPVSTIEVLAQSVGLVIDPARVPILEADYAVAHAMLEDLHNVETELVPDSPFDPSWPELEAETDR